MHSFLALRPAAMRVFPGEVETGSPSGNAINKEADRFRDSKKSENDLSWKPLPRQPKYPISASIGAPALP
jgi:hypothetical protein